MFNSEKKKRLQHLRKLSPIIFWTITISLIVGITTLIAPLVLYLMLQVSKHVGEDPAITFYTLLYILLTTILVVITYLIYLKHYRYIKILVVINLLLFSFLSASTFLVTKSLYMEKYEIACSQYCGNNYRKGVREFNTKICYSTCMEQTYTNKKELKELSEEEKNSFTKN